MSKQVASLNPENFAEGGGLIDDTDVVFDECVFDMFDYNGTIQPGVPSLKLSMTGDDFDGTITQYYSMGNANDWIPSEDGSQLVKVGKADNIRLTSNGGIFLKALVDAGFPADELGDDISVLNGLQAHVIQIPAPERPGIKQKERADGKSFPKTILVVQSIIAMPGDKKVPKGAPKKTAAAKKAAPKKTAAKAAPAGNDAITEKCQGAVLEILAESGTITAMEIPGKLFISHKDDEDRSEMIQTVLKAEFLASGPWTYDKGAGTLTLG